MLGSLARLDPQTRGKHAVEEIKTFILHNLDLLADPFISLGEQFLSAAEDADPERLEALAAQGAPVNYHDPRNGLTALHYVAAQGARRAFRALLRIRDWTISLGMIRGVLPRKWQARMAAILPWSGCYSERKSSKRARKEFRWTSFTKGMRHLDKAIP